MGERETSDSVEQVRARITALEVEVATWRGMAERLASTMAHLAFDTPASMLNGKQALAVAAANTEQELAAADAKLALPGSSEEQQKARRQERKAKRQALRDLNRKRRELHNVELALPNPKTTSRDLRVEVQYRAISKFVATAMEAISQGHAPIEGPDGRNWRCKDDVVYNAAQIFGTCQRTVREAIARYPAPLFTEKVA
jgi:hypothetical protein